MEHGEDPFAPMTFHGEDPAPTDGTGDADGVDWRAAGRRMGGWLSRHTPLARRPMTALIAVSACCMLLGLTVLTVQRSAGEKRDQAYAACTTARDRWQDEASRFSRSVEGVLDPLDMDALRDADPAGAERITRLAAETRPPASCEGTMGVKDLAAAAASFNDASDSFDSRVSSLRKAVAAASASMEDTARAKARERLSEAVSQARETLSRTAGVQLRVPYLRDRLSRLVDDADTMLADPDASADDMDRLASNVAHSEEWLLDSIR